MLGGIVAFLLGVTGQSYRWVGLVAVAGAVMATVMGMNANTWRVQAGLPAHVPGDFWPAWLIGAAMCAMGFGLGWLARSIWTKMRDNPPA